MTHSVSLQAAVALRALRGDLTPAEVAAQYGVTEAQVAAWRDRLAARAATVFETPAAEDTAPETGDVTRRKQAEHALRENEARLRLALDAAELGTWRWEVASGTDRQEWDARCRAARASGCACT